MSRAAVITGDLIDSRKAGPDAVDAAMSEILAVAQAVSAPFARYRGDGWQVLLTAPEHCLRFCLLTTARLRSRSAPLSRFAIGIGAVPATRAASLAAETGPAFVTSGAVLDSMPRRQAFALESLHALAGMTVAAARLADQIARKWSPPQAEAMALALSPEAPSGAAIAQALGISPAAASYRLQGAHGWDIKAVVAAFEQELRTHHG